MFHPALHRSILGVVLTSCGIQVRWVIHTIRMVRLSFQHEDTIVGRNFQADGTLNEYTGNIRNYKEVPTIKNRLEFLRLSTNETLM